MHPAYSVILFTTASGAGYGLLFWLCMAGLLGRLPAGAAPVIALTLSLALVTVGLLSSTLHLGHPERAWRAFSQWRSSWLSREGVCAVATYAPAGVLWLVWLFGIDAAVVPVLAVLSAIGAIATVWCTGMIYASLRTVPEWYRADVAPLYLLLASATGALLMMFVTAAAGQGVPGWLAVAAVASILAAGALKLRYWAAITDAPRPYTVEQATGLGALGQVRVLDPPHTSPNFVMREMGYQVARKHSDVLRKLTLLALFAIPLAMIVCALLFPAPPVAVALAVASAAFGVVVERWLFFADARHLSMLFYQGT